MKYLLPGAVLLLILATGMSLDGKQFLASWKNLSASHWARLLLATFLIPPLLVLGLGAVLPIDLPALAGLYLVAVAPGAPLMSRNAAKRGFDLHQAASYQVWGALVAPIVIPLLVAAAAWIYGPVKDLLRRYVDVRLKFEALSPDPAALADGLRQSASLENELWQHAKAAAKEAPSPITATFIVTLNEMIDTDSERVTAHRNRIPAAVWILLVGVAAFGCLTSAYGAGAQGARSAFTNVFLPLIISFVILLIFDLMHPHQGVVSISQQPMLDLKASMAEPAP